MTRSTAQPLTIVVDTDNTDGTHAAWWAIVDLGRHGVEALVAGPYFSRPEATEALGHMQRGHPRPHRLIVYAFAGKGQYRVAWETATRDPPRSDSGNG